ncbi:MAG TPA: glycosyltransferase [Leeuwenhoekiella sp.]|nr:glycosyltransferase [Leeuwenhoekiella sp.]
MNLLFQHPLGNANVRAALQGIRRNGALQSFHTTVACFKGSTLDKLANVAPFSELKKREYDSNLELITNSYPIYEISRIISEKIGLNKFVEHEKGVFSVDSVYQNLDRRATSYLKKNKHKIDAIYAYEDGAEFCFGEAKMSGISCFYDLPIGYWRTALKLLEPEQQRWPEWASTLSGFQDSNQKLKRKDRELKLADHIFVASSFTAKSLQDYPGQLPKIEVIPYGFPKPVEKRTYYKTNGKLKLLFVGGLSQRKGIADIFAAVEHLQPHVSLTVVGRKSTQDCKAMNEALSKHTWIPALPHHEILELMRAHDVLLFPSLFEGFGLVITEAMSQGTPVITTDRTAGPDLIDHGDNGWLIEAGSTEKLKNSIEYLLDNRTEVVAAGKAAMESARKRPWEVYGNELAEAILKFHNERL